MHLFLTVLALISATPALSTSDAESSLAKARDGFQTKLTERLVHKDRPTSPPDGISLVRYEAPTGKANAYITDAPSKSGPHPAIIWVTGGFPCGGASESVFQPGDHDNDQSAYQYREEGVITLYPSLRGSFGVRGAQELFLGEVDDILAALDYLRTRDDVDPARIFLGGHSTGGTLALLVSEVPNDFRAVFSFGPVARCSDYGASNLPFDWKSKEENFVRSPIHHLDGIKTPTFIFEGDKDANTGSLEEIRDATKNRAVKCAIVPGADHFEYISALNQAIARAIVADDRKSAFSLNPKKCVESVTESIAAQLDATTTRVIAAARGRGIELKQSQTFTFRAWSWKKSSIEALRESKEATKFDLRYVGAQGKADDRWYLLEVRAEAKPNDLTRCCKLSAEVHEWARSHGAQISRFYIESSD